MKKRAIGHRRSDGKTIYLSAPSWDCGWYWGFGYLGNRNEHYHLSSYQDRSRMEKTENGYLHLTERRNINLRDALIEDYELVEPLRKNLWEFCELVLTAYTLKETAEVLGRGGSHMTHNPLSELIKNNDEVKRINEEVLPAIFKKIDDLFES